MSSTQICGKFLVSASSKSSSWQFGAPLLLILISCATAFCGDDLPHHPYLDANALDEISTAFSAREAIVNQPILITMNGEAAAVSFQLFDLLNNYYTSILPKQLNRETNLKQAKANYQRAFGNAQRAAQLAGGFAGRMAAGKHAAAVQALTLATTNLQAAKNVFESSLPTFRSIQSHVQEAQQGMLGVYFNLKRCLPKDSTDPRCRDVTAAFEAGFAGTKPAEAYILAAISAAYLGDEDRMRQHLIRGKAEMAQLPVFPALRADFCTLCILSGENSLCEDELKEMTREGRTSTDPHVLSSIAVCRAFGDGGVFSSYAKRAAVAAGDIGENQTATPTNLILSDCLAVLGSPNASLPKTLEEFRNSEWFKESGSWRSLIAQAKMTEDDDVRKVLIGAALERSPPCFDPAIQKFFEANANGDDKEKISPPQIN